VDAPWYIFLIAGFVAQLIDGSLGMAFGVSATTLMLSFGVPPAQASAIVHIAEVFTTGASGASHIAHRNVDWSLVRRLAIPGAIGGILGATVLSNVDGNLIRPFVVAYLAVMGAIIVWKALRMALPEGRPIRGIPLLGFVGGFLDAVGGGGWGPIVTSTLIGRGQVPRMAIGSVNTTEFVVTLCTSTAFIVSLGTVNVTELVWLVVGGLLAAPVGGYLAKRIATRPLMIIVGVVVMILSGLQFWTIVQRWTA
jgi:uncharacterized membrane protein YfcA